MKFILIPLAIVAMFLSFVGLLAAFLFYSGRIHSIEDFEALIRGTKADTAGINPSLVEPEDRLDSLFKALEARKTYLEEQSKELATVQKEILRRELELEQEKSELGLFKAQDDSLRQALEEKRKVSIAQTAKLYEAMRAADAAAILEDTEDTMAAWILSGIKERPAGKILSSMNPDKAAKITNILTEIKAK